MNFIKSKIKNPFLYATLVASLFSAQISELFAQDNTKKYIEKMQSITDYMNQQEKVMSKKLKNGKIELINKDSLNKIEQLNHDVVKLLNELKPLLNSYISNYNDTEVAKTAIKEIEERIELDDKKGTALFHNKNNAISRSREKILKITRTKNNDDINDPRRIQRIKDLTAIKAIYDKFKNSIK